MKKEKKILQHTFISHIFSARKQRKENEPGFGKLGTTRILVLMPCIRGSSSL